MIAQGRSDVLGARTINEAFPCAVRLARKTLGVCIHCRENLAGNRCKNCAGIHSTSCCECASCGCGCQSDLD